jgi:predicted secreted hydrolase
MMRRLAPIVGLLVAAACGPPATPPPPARLQVADVLGGVDTRGFARALEPHPFAFPTDHGPHAAFASEWWYFTGNLANEAGRAFGYQLTFFRSSLQPPGEAAPRASAWAANEVWMAHFALTDVAGGRLHAFERFQRGALGLAGAQADPWRVWLDDWRLQQEGPGAFPVRLQARAAGIAIDLLLESAKPAVLPGSRGLSAKGPEPGNASYYYSFTRLPTRGAVELNGRAFAVQGDSWLDREWGTSALGEGVVGWDWFALQLDDGTELMYYRLRQADGDAAPQSAGVLVAADGSWEPLAAADLELAVHDRWTSPRHGTVYPAAWTLAVPGRGIALRVTPRLPDQELDLSFRYWEGAVQVEGAGVGGAPVGGRGYAELTGYAEGGLHP